MSFQDTIDQLTEEVKSFAISEEKRLFTEINFIDSISTEIDFMIGSMVDGLMEELDADITSHTGVTEDKQFLKSLLYGAIKKAINPFHVTGTSDAITRSTIGLSSGLSSIYRSISSSVNSALDEKKRIISHVPDGSFNSVKEHRPGLFDKTKKVFTKVFNTIGMITTFAPSIIPSFAKHSLNSFVEKANQVNDVLLQTDDYVQQLQTILGSLDPSYYAVDQFSQSSTARSKLEEADRFLVNVRSTLFTNNSFNNNRFNKAVDAITVASQALSFNGNTSNKVIQAMGLLTELNFLKNKSENGLKDIIYRKNNLSTFMTSFENNSSYNSSVMGILNNVQSEIRSLSRSIKAVVEKKNASTMPQYRKLWWAVPQMLLGKMKLIPNRVNNYFVSDPDNYVSTYHTLEGNLSAINIKDHALLKSQMKQIAYWGIKKLTSDISMTQFNIIANQLMSDNHTRRSNINAAINLALSYPSPITDNAKNVIRMLTNLNLDRAKELLVSGDIKEFFSLNSQTATKIGNLENKIQNAINITKNLKASFDGLAALNKALRYVRNRKRSRDTLAGVLTTFKDDAISFKINVESKEIDLQINNMNRYLSEWT